MNKILLFILSLFLLIAVNATAIEQRVIMEIEGMTCALCQIAIKKSLSEIDGVKDAKISYKERKAWLTVDELVSDALLIEAVQKVGQYRGKVLERTP